MFAFLWSYRRVGWSAINTTLGTLGVLGHGNASNLPLVLNIALTWLVVGMVVKVFGRDLQREETSKESTSGLRRA